MILQRQHVVDLAGRQWAGSLISLRGALMCILDPWEHIPVKGIPPTCPIEFSEEETREQAENEEMWYNLNALVSHWRDELGGLSGEDWIPGDKSGFAVNRSESLKAQFAEGGRGAGENQARLVVSRS